MKKLENTFSWSPSRAASFEYCQRQYWWNYYGAWGGWEFTAAPESKLAYVLKNLHNRFTWVGTVVHEAIERVLRKLLEQGTSGELFFSREPIDVETEVVKVTTRMREDWRESRGASYRERPKHRFGLVEHEYEDEVPGEEWKTLNARAKKAMRDFLTSDLFREIEASDPHHWLPIEQLGQFEFEGVPIWAAIDFARRTQDGRVLIYDWKTGEMKDSYRTQLGVYAMYMEAAHGVPPEQVTTNLVFLGDSDMQIETLPTMPEDIEETRARIRESVAAMRNRMRDVEANAAEPERFPLTEERWKCSACCFRRLCNR